MNLNEFNIKRAEVLKEIPDEFKEALTTIAKENNPEDLDQTILNLIALVIQLKDSIREFSIRMENHTGDRKYFKY